MKKNNPAKERILKSAIVLFSKKGFSATGVREIVQHAEVNISMVNYYFKSKAGILIEIMEIFYGKVYEGLLKNLKDDDGFEERIKKTCRIIVEIILEDEALFKISLFELPFENEEIREFKAEKVNKILALVYGTIFNDYIKQNNKGLRLEIIGPALSGILYSHFIFKPVLEDIMKLKFEKGFYDEYIDYISDIILNGVKSKMGNNR